MSKLSTCQKRGVRAARGKHLLLLVIFGLIGPPKVRAQQLQQPIALDALPSVGIVVLGSNGTVYELRGKDGEYSIAKSFDILGGYYPIDLTLAQVRQEFYIVVATNGTGLYGAASGRVWQYSLTGKVMSYWDVKGGCAGIDYDGRTHTVYLASPDSASLLSISLLDNGKSTVSFLGEVRGAEQIGPIAFDGAKNAIYASDVGLGGIYKFDLASGKSSMFFPRLSDVTALRVGESAHRLVAADSRGNITVLDVTATPTVVRTIKGVKHPSGLAPVDSGWLAVSDRDGSIAFISDDGRIVAHWE